MKAIFSAALKAAEATCKNSPHGYIKETTHTWLGLKMLWLFFLCTPSTWDNNETVEQEQSFLSNRRQNNNNNRYEDECRTVNILPAPAIVASERSKPRNCGGWKANYNWFLDALFHAPLDIVSCFCHSLPRTNIIIIIMAMLTHPQMLCVHLKQIETIHSTVLTRVVWN